jgi:hypothetical protein
LRPKPTYDREVERRATCRLLVLGEKELLTTFLSVLRTS